MCGACVRRGVSVDLKGKMTLGVVQKEDKGVTSRFKVTKFPSVCLGLGFRV